jgi:hypothetical protein
MTITVERMIVRSQSIVGFATSVGEENANAVASDRITRLPSNG